VAITKTIGFRKKGGRRGGGGGKQLNRGHGRGNRRTTERGTGVIQGTSGEGRPGHSKMVVPRSQREEKVSTGPSAAKEEGETKEVQPSWWAWGKEQIP